jgi:hypothetical protein
MGGNPIGPSRLLDNLNSNAPGILSESFETLEDVELFAKSTLYKELKGLFSKDELVKEVKDLNKTCYSEARGVSYTIERVQPYKIDSAHKGISRVLQSFEVVLLSVLVRSCLKQKLLPMSLDHDGLLAIYKGDQNIRELAQFLTEEMTPWSNYLLSKEGLALNMPIEPKLLISDGNIIK